MKNNIKQLRQALWLTQQDLADLVKVRRETVVFLEAWKYNPSLKLWMQIAKILKKNVEEIFELEDEDWKFF